MNLLHLTSWFPFPPDTGGRIDSINFARALGKEHQVTLVCFSEQTPSEEALAALKPYYHAIHTIPLTKQDIIKSLLLSFITPLPINIQKYKSVKMQRFLETLVKSKSFDFVRIDHLHMSHYRDCFKGIPTILRKQNIDATIMRRYYEQQTNPVVKTLARQQYRKLLQFEKQASLAFQNCVMITHEDASQLETMSPGVHTSVIPCGIDLSDYSSIHQRQPEPYRITYLGSMDWSPNEDAVIYFLQDIWPRVKSHYPQAEFYIVGRNPTKRVRELARQPGIIVTGYVEDIKPYLEKTRVMVVPLRIGSGMRIKILEAMAMGIPIVTTPIGMEGIEVTPGQDLLVAEEPVLFAEQILRLFQSPELEQQLAIHAKNRVGNTYSLEIINDNWAKLIDNVINRR